MKQQVAAAPSTDVICLGWRLAVEAGVELLGAGAETARVEDTVERIGRAVGAKKIDAFVTPTGLFAAMEDADGASFTTVRRIRYIENNIAVITAINSMSRDLAEGKSDVFQAWDKLCAVKRNRLAYTPAVVAIAAGIFSGAFAHLFQGKALDMLFALLCGYSLSTSSYFLRRWGVNMFLRSSLGGVIAAIWGLIATTVSATCSRDAVILGGLMVLVPGAVITGAVRDVMSGELVSGVSRAAEALMVALAIAVGVAAVFGLGGVV